MTSLFPERINKKLSTIGSIIGIIASIIGAFIWLNSRIEQPDLKEKVHNIEQDAGITKTEVKHLKEYINEVKVNQDKIYHLLIDEKRQRAIQEELNYSKRKIEQDYDRRRGEQNE